MKAVRAVLFGLIVSVASIGCMPDGVVVEDSLDFALFASELHTPYVVGTDMSISAWRQDGGSVKGWAMRSTDESIFRVALWDDGNSETDVIHAAGTALSAGEVELEVLDGNGHIRAVREIHVVQPDRVRLVPAGLARVRPELAAPIDFGAGASVLAGGWATFEVEYYKGEERLFGNGALDLGGGLSGQAYSEQTYLFLNREWLILEPEVAGDFELSLLVGDLTLAVLSVKVVEADAIARVEILAEEPKGAEDGDVFYLLARAFDVAEAEIFGVAFDWEVDGRSQTGTGDLFAYTYCDGAWADVSADAGDRSDNVAVEMEGGYVTSSNYVGCATSPGSRTDLGPVGLLTLVVLGLRLRRD